MSIVVRNYGFSSLAIPSVLLFLVVFAHAEGLVPAHHDRPLMRDFIGLNVHTVQFKPALYAPVCRCLRDYHPFVWDIGDNTAQPTVFPEAANRVDWGQMYGSWNKSGFDIDACIMFDNLASAKWNDRAADARAYGESFARFFGPSGAHPLVSSIEIGNEPAKYTEAEYRTIFESMARGVRIGDAKLKIATCAVMTGKPDQWSKPMSAIAGLEKWYDVLNVHSYAFKEKWPTWRRSYPEDPAIRYLTDVDDVIHWRDAHAPGKQVWLTEFGYDSTTKSPPAKGDFAKWEGVNDEQQAQYIVRSFLVLSAMDIDRAYLYFFNDKDEPQLHGSSGITRDFVPKSAFYAMSHLYQTLGDFRLARAVIQVPGELYCFEYQQAAPGKGRIFVAWLPTGAANPVRKRIHLGPSAASVYRAQRIALSATVPASVEYKVSAGEIELEVGPTPVFLWAK